MALTSLSRQRADILEALTREHVRTEMADMMHSSITDGPLGEDSGCGELIV